MDQEFPTIHYTELPPAQPDNPLRREYDFYRREVGRLLAEGQEGKYVLIKGEEIIGFFETDREAVQEGYRRFLMNGFYVHQVQTRERLYRTVYSRSCLS